MCFQIAKSGSARRSRDARTSRREEEKEEGAGKAAILKPKLAAKPHARISASLTVNPSTVRNTQRPATHLSANMEGPRRSTREKTKVDNYFAVPKLPEDSEEESGEEPRSSGDSEGAEVEDAKSSTDGEDDHEDMQDDEEDLEEGEVLSIESIDGGDEGEGEDAGASSDAENGDEDEQDEEDDSEDGAENLEDDDQDTDEKIDERPTKRTKPSASKSKLQQIRIKSGMKKKEHFAKGFENLPELDRSLTALLLPEVESDPSTNRLLALKKLLDGINENDMAAAPHTSRPDNEDDLLRLPKVKEVIGRVYSKSSDSNRRIIFRVLDLGTDVTGLTPKTVKLKNFAKMEIRNYGHTTAALEAALPELIRFLERMPDEYWNKASSLSDRTTLRLLLQIAINRKAPTTSLVIHHRLVCRTPNTEKPSYR